MDSTSADCGKADDDYYDLGSFHRPVTTAQLSAQTWFDRGLAWCYGFNHEEAANCFRRAVSIDSECPMAYWGIAYSLGPNYNKPWDAFDERELQRTLQEARDAMRKAEEKAGAVGGVEQALVKALRARYPETQTDEPNRREWDAKFAEAMGAVYAAFPDDSDVAALCAEALMNLTPWKLWDIRTGEPAPGARTLEAKAVLERGLSRDAFHPGLLHFYIHLTEMSRHPEMALRWADNLRGLVPDAGHLNHMPTHLDILCGDYRRAISSNSQAILADAKFVRRDGPMNFYTLYRCHDYHFRIYAALFAGQSRVAIDTAGELEGTLPEELLRVESPPMADWLEGFLAMRVHVLVRFGLWDEILELELPGDAELYCATTAMMRYAKGVALAATGRIQEAERERARFDEAVKRVPASRTLFNNTCVELLAIADAMLRGELEYRRGNFDAAFEHLRRAVALDDALPYDEPWGWMQPTRHAYGALLLEQGRVEDALRVYAADLGFSDELPRPQQHRNNVWALHGYHECLKRLGRAAEARLIEPQLEIAVAVADVEIKASCFCRRD